LNMEIIRKPELLAPVGNWKMLHAAIQAGADAVYFGIDKMNMRAKAENFKSEDLDEIVNICKKSGVDTHLTINSILYEDELEQLHELLANAKKAEIDLVICWDMAVIEKCIELEVPFCISTQASISNSASAKMYAGMGASRIVLARECTLEKIIEIRKSTEIEIEAFVHGAMCVAVSGRCFMSHSVFGKSANRGECIQPCRREYKIYDKDGQSEFLIGEDYVMSPKDLCSIQFIDQLIEAGISSFKVEGRKRSPEYIKKVITTYRKAIDLYFEGKLTGEIKEEFYNDLKEVYNRGFSPGFYFGTPDGENFTEQYGSQATTKKKYAGKVVNYFKKTKIAHLLLLADGLETGEEIYVIGNKTGVVETSVGPMMKNEKQISTASKGDEVTFYCDEEIRPRDQIYKIIKTAT